MIGYKFGTQVRDAQFRKLAPAFLAEIERRFPLTADVEIAVQAYVEGRLAGDDAWGIVMRSVQDLSVFSSWLAKDWSEVSKATLWIRESGERMTRNWLDLADRVNALVESQRGNLTDEQVWAIGDKESRNLVRRIVLDRVKGLSNADQITDAALWTLAPSTMLVASMLIELMRATVLRSGTPRKPKPSDAGDMLHAVYLPYVDLYRTDSFAADKLERLGPQSASRIVRRFLELPARIEALLLERE